MSNQKMEEWANLARALVKANDERNLFTEQFYGFDNFAEVWQHVGNNRELYDKLSDKALEALKRVEEEVSDKKALVKYLKSLGEKDLARRMSRILNV